MYIPSEIKAINITDKNIKYVKIPYGGYYLIDGEVVHADSYGTTRVKCNDLDNIRYVTKNRYIIEYRSGYDILTPSEYEDRKYELYKKCRKEEYDDSEKWETLEDEFAYRKFVETWQPIYKDVQIMSDPIKVVINEIVYDTGIPYIKSAFLNGDSDDETLYSYTQGTAWKDCCLECFDELGMSFVEDINYNKTANTKIWGNSSHSCIRYVVAFGTYVFGDSWGNPRVIKGTLEDVKARYQRDCNSIRNIIMSQYNKHFGNIDAGQFDFQSLIKKLETSSNYLRKLKVYAKSSENYYHALNLVSDAINQINAAYNSSQLPTEDETPDDFGSHGGKI